MISIKTIPPHPGQLLRATIKALREKTKQPFTQAEIAQGLGIARKTLSTLLNGHSDVNAIMALRLSTAFQNTSAEYWLEAQEKYDLYVVRANIKMDKVVVLWNPF